MQSPLQKTIVYAKLRGSAPANNPQNYRILDVRFYDIIANPPTPLHVGQKVDIRELYTEQEGYSIAGTGELQAKKSGVDGTIEGVRLVDNSTVKFVVRNKTPRSLISHAHILIPRINGETVALEWWRKILWWSVARTIPVMRTITTGTSVKIWEPPRTTQDAYDEQGEWLEWPGWQRTGDAAPANGQPWDEETNRREMREGGLDGGQTQEYEQNDDETVVDE